MKKLLWVLALVASLNLSADEPKPAASPLTAVESLVGGVWVAQMEPAKDSHAALLLELRFAWTDNHQSVRFASAWVRGDKRKAYTDGFYAWNAAKQKLAIFYTDAGGNLTEGLITPEGDVLVNDLVSTAPDGKAEPIQVRLTKDGPDAFTNAIFLQKDGAWAPFVTVRYERQK
jgi:hypothetical protein